ncbi:MAG: hypothetical protein GEU79_02200 [Acidimicrobiia bacterium]|nr:hypothetical protein [Acidimicrobiia bacterium]
MQHGSLPLRQRLYRLLKNAIEEFGSDKAGRMAAALSYYTMFAMVPILFLAVGITGVVLSGQDVVGDIVEQAREFAGDTIADELGGVLDFVTTNSGSFIGIGALVAAFAASGIFLQTQGVLNAIFHTPEERTAGILSMVIQRGIALVAALLIAVLAFVPLLAVGAVGLIRRLLLEIPGMPVAAGTLLANVGVPLISVVMLMLVIAMTFHALVRVSVPWKAARRGGIFTAALILGGAFIVGLLIQYGLISTDSSGRSALGAFGGIAILLLFFNVMWQIYLFGAEVTKVYADYLEHGDFMTPSQRTEASLKARLLATDSPFAPPPSVGDTARTGVTALLVGLVVGWWLNRD